MREVNKIFIDEKKFLKIADNLKDKISSMDPYPDLLVGILKGGKYLTEKLSSILNIEAQYIRIHSRDGKSGSMRKMRIGYHIDISIPTSLLTIDKNILIVDDIYDSGTTMKIAQRLLPGSPFCVLLTKNKGIKPPNLYGEFVDPDQWVEFYWEY